jgi:hypothetical protein
MLTQAELEHNIESWARAHRLNKSVKSPFNKYSNLNLAEADQSLRGDRGKLHVKGRKLYDSQSGRTINTRNALESDLFGWLYSNDELNLKNITSGMTVTSVNGAGRNYKKRTQYGKPLKFGTSIMDRILRK